MPPMGVLNFIGRKQLLKRLDSCFQEEVEGRNGGRAVVVVLIGMGGKSLKSAGKEICCGVIDT